jgi:transketolase
VRNEFLKSVIKLAKKDKDIILLTADLGYGVFEEYEAMFPNQYFNVGVAEQSMTSIATGLAIEGKKVITYSIGNFPTLRCLEQIRNDACYHETNVTIVASGGGFSYGALGMSHHATEDLSILRALPGVKVVAPCTTWEAGKALTALVEDSGVGYLRLDKSCAADTLEESSPFTFKKSRRHREGDNITIIATGGILKEALESANELIKKDISVRVIGMHTIKPIDIAEIKLAAEETGGIITVEENNYMGGLGGAVAETCMDLKIRPKIFYRIGLNDVYSSIVGSQDYLRKIYKMDSEAITMKILSLLK